LIVDGYGLEIRDVWNVQTELSKRMRMTGAQNYLLTSSRGEGWRRRVDGELFYVL
jgi:hypothetical protein